MANGNALLDKVKGLATKRLIDNGLWVLFQQNQMKHDDPLVALRETMRDIGRIQMEPGGRAFRFLEHFLAGKGTPIEIDVKALVENDEGVRTRVVAETHRRVMALLHDQKNAARPGQRMTPVRRDETYSTARERRDAANQKVSKPALTRNIDPVISVFQSNFKNKDWQSAVGSYALEIELMSSVNPAAQSFWVMLKGAGRYRWHPDAPRVTQEVHVLGQMLIDEGAAAEFEMPGKTYYMQVSTKEAEILKLTSAFQTNPRSGNGTFADGAWGRAGKVVIDNGVSAMAKAASSFVQRFGGTGF